MGDGVARFAGETRCAVIACPCRCEIALPVERLDLRWCGLQEFLKRVAHQSSVAVGAYRQRAANQGHNQCEEAHCK
jgi:hypothetical protein